MSTSPFGSRGDLISPEVIFRIGLILVGFSVFITIFGPWLAPYPPEAASSAVSRPPPSLADWPSLLMMTMQGRLSEPVHWLGTDAAGSDILSRVLVAPRTDLVIAVGANAVSLVLGTVIGLLCGYFRGWTSEVTLRASDVLQSFPVLISGMILVALAGRTTFNIALAIGLLYTPVYIRLTATEVRAQKSRGYVEASRAVGLHELAIAIRHVLPNALAPSLIQVSVMIGFAILMTAGLSFVGAGVRPPTPEWGLMISNGVDGMVQGDWWLTVFPGLAISITVFGFAALGNGLEGLYRR